VTASDADAGALWAGSAAAGRVLAIDYGERRIGLAVSDPTRTIASPAGFIARRHGKRPPVAELARQAAHHHATAIVMGLPLDDEGDETPRSAEVRRVAAALEQRTGLSVTFIDERYSTAAALRAIREMGGSTRGRRGDIDALAATILLQHALESLPR
jgi:putative holliday junction resolvase